MDRIAVIGCCGAGKTQLSLELGRKLGLPVIHLDQLSRDRGWDQVPNDVFARRQQAALAPDGRWIADGNCGTTMPLRLALADTIVFLDFPTPLCLYRVIARRVRHRGRSRPDMAPDCPERVFDLELPKFLHFVATFRARQRPRILAKLAELAGTVAEPRVITLTNPREAARFLDGVTSSPA